MSQALNELRDSARQVLGKLGLAADENQTWPLLVELGWLLVALPEDDGGLEQGLAGAVAFHTELGRGLAAAPYASALLAIDAVQHAEFAQRQSFLERLTAAEYVAAPMAASHLDLRRDGSRLLLTGGVAALESADRATHLLLSSQDDRCVALVPTRQPGLSLRTRNTWDPSRRLFEAQLQDVPLDPALLLAQGEAAQLLCRRLRSLRELSLAADAVGGAAAALTMTVEYLQTRRQFGRPLALFQALKHRCADLCALSVAAEAQLADTVSRYETRLAEPDGELAAKTARQLACSVYARVAEEALQLHGGIGMTSEHACHRFLKRALLDEQLGLPAAQAACDIAGAFIAAC